MPIKESRAPLLAVQRQRETGQVGGDALRGKWPRARSDPHVVDHLAAEADQRGADRVDGDVQGQATRCAAQADQW